VFKHELRDGSETLDPAQAQGDLGSLRVTDEELMQDLLTRKILQTNSLDSSDDDLQSQQITKPDLTGGRRGL